MIPYSMEYIKRTVVIYARVSTEHEAQVSALENQLDWYKPLLEFHPEWTLVERYIDEGITGTSAEKRPEFMRMMEDAKKHKFDMILTREVSRFARNTVDTLQYTRMLKEHGVEVYFINDGIKTFDGDGELRLTIMATLAQDESRKTSIRVKSGQQTSMNNGVYYGNGNILGYDRYEEILPDKSKLVEFRINPEQAKTVRLIFDMYLDGCGLTKIKDELERRGYKTSQGMDSWYPTVISHVLKNTFYCGILTYHKEYVKDYLKQKKVKNYGEIEFTQAEGTHTPIVTVEEFERVQRIMEAKRTECKNLNVGPRSKGKKPRTTVWGKLLICECGHTFNTRRWDRADRQPGNAYQCYSSVRTGSYESRKKKGLPLEGICQSPMIPEWRLQMMANLIFRQYLSEKDKVLALANSILEAHIGDEEETRNIEAMLASRRSELERLSRKIDNYIEMRADGDLSRETFRTKCAELEPRMQQLQKEIEELSAEAQPKEVVDYKEKLEVLQYALEQYTHRNEGEDVPESVIEAFVVKIVVSKDSFDWYLRFDGDPDKPLRCSLKGKRKTTTKITVSGGNSPAMDNSPTGCGKTTFLNCLTRIHEPSEGDLYIDGEPADPRKHNISFVFQEPSALPWLSVEENIAYGLKIKRLPQEEIDRRVNQILDLMGLQDSRKKYPGELSVSAAQRVIIGRSFAMQPDLLLMDEPYGQMDVKMRFYLEDEVIRLWKELGSTVVFITHNIEEAVYLAERVIILSNKPANIKEEVRIDLPHPRNVADPKFIEYRNYITDKIKWW